MPDDTKQNIKPEKDDLVEVVDLESSEEAAFRADIEKDEYQKQLDKAIEEKRLTDVIDRTYEFDAKEFEVEIEVLDVKYAHRLTRPTLTDEMRKEAMAMTVRKDAGKLHGDNMLATTRDDNNAMRRFYDAIADSVWGYAISEADDPEQWIKVSTVVDAATGDEKAKTLLAYIPDADKIKAARKVYQSSSFVIYEKGKRLRSIKSRREYIVKQMFGIERNDEGDLSRPSHVVAYHFNEGTSADIAYFDTKCQTSRALIKKEGRPEDLTTISISEAVVLFDRLINYVQGGTVKGEEVRNVANGDSRLAEIPPRCKTDAVFVYMNHLKS